MEAARNPSPGNLLILSPNFQTCGVFQARFQIQADGLRPGTIFFCAEGEETSRRAGDFCQLHVKAGVLDRAGGISGVRQPGRFL